MTVRCSVVVWCRSYNSAYQDTKPSVNRGGDAHARSLQYLVITLALSRGHGGILQGARPLAVCARANPVPRVQGSGRTLARQLGPRCERVGARTFGAASAHVCVDADAAGRCASTTRHEAAAEAHPQAGPRCCAPLQPPGRRRCATAGDGHRWRASAGPSVGCHGITRGRVVFAVWEVQRRWQSEARIEGRCHLSARD